jgi:hypothetical protein
MTSRNSTPSTLLAENTEDYKEKTKMLTRAQVEKPLPVSLESRNRRANNATDVMDGD